MTYDRPINRHRIRDLSDSLRHTFAGGKVMMAAAVVQSLPAETVALA